MFNLKRYENSYIHTLVADILATNQTTNEKLDSLISSAAAQELYGADISTRPEATAVPVGSTFVVVANPIIIYISDGQAWIEVS